MNNTNPFGDILAQMNQAKATYDATLSGLQQQMQAARQQAASMYANPYQQQPIAPVNSAAQPLPSAVPQPSNEVPAHIQQLSALGEIRSAIEKTNELLDKFVNGVPVKEKSNVKNQKTTSDENTEK